jgi:hypothetical protein
MKPLLIKYGVFFILQIILVWTIKPLTTSLNDQLFLLGCNLVLGLLFLFGTFRLIQKLAVSQAQFNMTFFGGLGMRLIISLMLILIYLKLSLVPNIKGVIFMICSYFIFVGFEIQFILPKLRTDSENSKNTDDARKQRTS